MIRYLSKMVYTQKRMCICDNCRAIQYFARDKETCFMCDGEVLEYKLVRTDKGDANESEKSGQQSVCDRDQ
jgi:hypothetical protein